MSDYRDPYNKDPLDPTAGPGMDSDGAMRSDVRRSNSGLGWIAGAVFVIVVLALIFGLSGGGDRTASTGGSPPAATTGAAPPAGPATAPRTTTGQGQ